MMRGFWSETNWRLDGDALLLPNGRRLLLKHILQWQTDLIEGRHDLTGKWPGWRIRQQWLIAPGGSIRQGRIAEHAMRQLVRSWNWESRETSRRQIALF